jgi:subtilase family serine protease
MRARLLGALLVAAVAVTAGPAADPLHERRAVARGSAPAPVFTPYSILLSHTPLAGPPTTAECRDMIGRSCYSPRQFRRAYHLKGLYRHGYRGHGQTIVIVVSFGSPTIRSQLRQFDRAFGIPGPPSFRIIAPVGEPPAYNSSNGTMVGWAQETSLDIEYAHAIAPRARLLLVVTPVAETLGTHGFPKIISAENYVLRHHLGGVISQSFGATEATFADMSAIRDLRGAVKRARRLGVTMLAASGDSGVTDARSVGSSGRADAYYEHRVNSWPSSDPFVTSVGGTRLSLSSSGKRLEPDRVWNDTRRFGYPSASGGGRSRVFGRPEYQDRVKVRTRNHRGTPDVAMSAADSGAAIVYFSAKVSGGRGAGFYLIGGTSLATPMFAGIVAIANQYAGHRLGFLNPALYRMAVHPKRNGIVDIRHGGNSVTFRQDGQRVHVDGFGALHGYDLASGLGTVNAARFVPALARVARQG